MGNHLPRDAGTGALDAGGHQQCDLSASRVVDAAALTAVERSNLRRRAVLRLAIQIDIALTWSLARATDAED
jgi:hypothetical protein